MKTKGIHATLLFSLILSGSAYASDPTPAGPDNSGTVTTYVNRIDGIVWDPHHVPVADVYVELQNEMMMSLARIRTTSNGRFSFTVTNPGNYVVRVLASGTNYLDASETVELVDVTRNSSDQAYVDIYLKIDKRKLNIGSPGIVEAVSVEDVPEDAKKFFELATADLKASRPSVFENLDKAIAIYPNYFAALNLAGTEHVRRKEFEQSFPYLIKAIDINQRSYSSYYALALACYQLKHWAEGVEAARGATVLQPAAANAQLLYGTLLRLNGNTEKAERVLLIAKNLSKDSPLPDVNMQLALLYNKTGRNREAVAELEAYLKTNPSATNKKEVQNLIDSLKKDAK